MVPLRAIEAGDTPAIVSARQGIMGHVATSGVSYVAGDPTHGQLIDHLASGSEEAIAWCFAVRRGGRCIGLVKAGQLHGDARHDKRLLDVAEALTCQFWATLADACRARAAQSRDPVTGLLTRECFLHEAERALTASYGQSEPVALAVITLEGTRALADHGHWERADMVATAAARLLDSHVRADDCLGRFDDSRFVVLLRRVDSALATLIAEQLVGKLTELCKQEQANTCRDATGADAGWPTIRCGISGTGTDQPPLAVLIFRAISECHEARQKLVTVSSDLGTGPGQPTATGARSQTALAAAGTHTDADGGMLSR
jgi:diguanylate cyclase (GGDEF)-like protein